MKHYLAAIFCAFEILALTATAVSAQPISLAEREKELSISTRRDPSYNASGIRFSRFILNADLTNTLVHKDNLYSSRTEKTADIVHKISPFLKIKSDFIRHYFSTELSAEKGMYKDNSSEDYTDYAARISMRVDASGAVQLPLSLGYNAQHSQRSDPDDQGELEPTQSKEIFLNTGFNYHGSNIDFLMRADIKNLTFKDNNTASSFIDNSDRDRNEISISSNLGYSKNNILAPFLYTNFEQINYKRKIDDNGLQRSSKGFIGGLGLNVSTNSSLLSSVISIGHVNRSFDDASLEDISGILYSANILWEPSTLLALGLLGSRNIKESTLNNFSSSIDSTISLSANYELAPNIFIKPKLSYLMKDYQGDTEKSLERLASDLDIIYKLSRNIWVLGGYTYIKQSDSEGSVDLGTFNTNSFKFSAKLQL